MFRSGISKKSGLKGQAAVELAIFCTILLLGFSVLLMYGQRMMAQQQLKMETFRAALGKAWDQNASVSITSKKDLRSYNLMGPFGQGQLSTIGASATAMWQKGLGGLTGTPGDETQFAYYKINDEEIRLPPYEKLITGMSGEEDQLVKVPVSVWKEDVVRTESHSYNATNEELAGGSTINKKKAILSDEAKYNIHVRFDKSSDDTPWDSDNNVLPEYVYETEPLNPEPGWGDTTIEEMSKVDHEYGAYYNETTGHVEYSKDKVGNKVVTEKETVTQTHE